RLGEALPERGAPLRGGSGSAAPHRGRPGGPGHGLSRGTARRAGGAAVPEPPPRQRSAVAVTRARILDLCAGLPQQLLKVPFGLLAKDSFLLAFGTGDFRGIDAGFEGLPCP